MSDRIVFDHEITVDGEKKNVKFAVRLPNAEELEKSIELKNTTFAKALKSKVMLKAKLETYMREQDLWDDAKQSQLSKLDSDIAEAEKALSAGNIKLSEAKDIAIKLKKLRSERNNMLYVRRELENNTAEGQADNTSFNYLVSACLVYNDTDTAYYKDLTDYLIHSSEPLAFLAGSYLASLWYGYDNDFEAKLAENKFLRQYGFVDEKYRLINKDGKLINENGALIDEDGNLVDSEGNILDHLGNKRDKDGNYIVDFKPFLDDDGNPIRDSQPPVEPPAEPVNEQISEPPIESISESIPVAATNEPSSA